MARITVKIDPNVCIAAASCVATEPEVFGLSEDNIAVVLGPDGSGEYERTLDVGEERRKKIIEASQSCPTGAISVVE
ncbi:MAG: ferredoxin [Bryobacteraceae bacterium]